MRADNGPQRLSFQTLSSPLVQRQRAVPFVSPQAVRQVRNYDYTMADPGVVSPQASIPIAQSLADDSMMARMQQSKLQEIVGPGHSLCK